MNRKKTPISKQSSTETKRRPFDSGRDQKGRKQPQYRLNHVTIAFFIIMQKLRVFIPSMTMINRADLAQSKQDGNTIKQIKRHKVFEILKARERRPATN